MPCGKTKMYRSMRKQYGKKKGRSVYFATKRKKAGATKRRKRR